MEEKKVVSKTKQIYLSVLGVLGFIVIVVGASYAYLSAQTVSGNIATNNISTSVVNYGQLKVNYIGSIALAAQDLKYSTAGTNIVGIVKFSVQSTSNTSNKFNINWAGTSRVTNTFSQTSTDIRNEATYVVYRCSDNTTYTNATAASYSTCYSTSGGSTIQAATPLPYSTTEKAGQIGATQTIAAGATNYYIMILTLYNKTYAQDYQAGASFTGALTMSGATN